MGRYFIKYSSPSSGRYDLVVFSAFLNYRLDNGSKLPVDQEPAWCRRCRTFVVAEHVETVEVILQRIEDLVMRRGELFEALSIPGLGLSVESKIAELRRRVGWRGGRRGPPRCLHCGSVEVSEVPRWGEFAHPEKELSVLADDWGFMSTDDWRAEFSPEGEVLPRGEPV
jgi:hypothetical protein